MDAIVIAGGVPLPGEPLYEFTQGRPKALLDIGGKPMVQWVVDALNQSGTVEQIVIVGLNEDSGLISAKPTAFTPSHGSMLHNIRAGMEKVLELNQNSHHVLTVSSDIPAIQGEMIDWVVNSAMETDHDIYYNVIPRHLMEARYPTSKRSYTRLKDIELCGGDMNVIRARTVTANEELWERIIAARKSVLKQAALVGFDTFFLLLIGQLILESGVKRVCRRLDITGRVLICPYPEVGMDIDKPHQLEILRQDLTQRVRA
jgi:molybdopterin-guanine dinucleotide biosynthesis protein A